MKPAFVHFVSYRRLSRGISFPIIALSIIAVGNFSKVQRYAEKVYIQDIIIQKRLNALSWEFDKIDL